jgi:8-oxo-dGTP pyrophosphatase MutT (NUDIX family)
VKQVAVAVAYNPVEEKFLMLKRAPARDVHAGKWEFASGKIEDEQAREAALRELEEETGFLGEVVRSAEPVEVDTEDGDFLIHPFLVVVKGTRPQLSREHTRWKWVFAEDVTEMDTVPELEKDLRALGIETSTGYSPN